MLEGTDFDLSFAFIPGDDNARIHTWVAHYFLLLQRGCRGNLILLLHWLLHLHKRLLVLLHLLLFWIVHGRSSILLLLILELLLLLLRHHLSGFDGCPIIVLMVEAIVLHRPLLLQSELVKRLLLLLLLLLGCRCYRLHDLLNWRLFKSWERPYIAEITVDVHDRSGDRSLRLLDDLRLRHMIMNLLLWLCNHLRLLLGLHHALWLFD